jgi:hypothetical protein
MATCCPLRRYAETWAVWSTMKDSYRVVVQSLVRRHKHYDVTGGSDPFLFFFSLPLVLPTSQGIPRNWIKIGQNTPFEGASSWIMTITMSHCNHHNVTLSVLDILTIFFIILPRFLLVSQQTYVTLFQCTDWPAELTLLFCTAHPCLWRHTVQCRILYFLKTIGAWHRSIYCQFDVDYVFWAYE